jgi:hypothetical protein
MWDFCPSEAASYIMLVCFILATCTHAIQTVIYRKPYCWVIVVSGLLQALAYLLRILSIQIQPVLDFMMAGSFLYWYVEKPIEQDTITKVEEIAPIWTNAFVYMVLGRMVWNFTKDGKIMGLASWRLGQMFVILDLMYGMELSR